MPPQLCKLPRPHPALLHTPHARANELTQCCLLPYQPSWARGMPASPMHTALMASMCTQTSVLRVLTDQPRPTAWLDSSCLSTVSTVP